MVPLDERRLDELIVESQDLQCDAMAGVRGSVADLADLAADRRRDAVEVDTDEIAAFNRGRRALVRRLGLGAGGMAAGGALAPALAALLAQPAAADQALDVQILQTASSLERLAVNTYAAALTLPFIKSGNQTVVKFAQTTMMQHDEHRKAFQAQTTVLGGKVQDSPNPKYAPVVEAAKPTLTTAAAVVALAAKLEQAARDTYLADLSMFTDTKSKQVMASVMGVETQHLATLRAVGALLSSGNAALIVVPFPAADIAKLPAAAGSVAFDIPIPMAIMASPPAEGAVQ